VFAVLVISCVCGAAVTVTAQPKIALLDSHNTREFFGKHYPLCNPSPVCDPDDPNCGPSYYLGAEEYQRYFRGWQYVLAQQGLDLAIIHDTDVTAEGLANYSLLILSNTALLSDDQTRAVHQWVIRGGRLLATFGSGYKDLANDPRQPDAYKEQKGGTFGLHQLWHDPVGKVFSTYWIDSGVDVNITRYEGPTEGLRGRLTGDLLHYGAEANLLVRRPINHPNVFAFLVIENPEWKATSPAIISTRQGKGLVVYFAFAPEYIVYKELEYSQAGLLSGWGWPVCQDGQNWEGRSTEPTLLMVSALSHLLGN